MQRDGIEQGDECVEHGLLVSRRFQTSWVRVQVFLQRSWVLCAFYPDLLAFWPSPPAFLISSWSFGVLGFF